MNARQKKFATILAIATPILLWRLSALTKYLPAAANAAPAEEAQAAFPGPGILSADAPGNAEELRAMVMAQQVMEAQPWGRDPFEPLASQEESPAPAAESAVVSEKQPPPFPRLRFTGVSRSGKRWMAMVQGGFVSVGDRIEGQFVVSAITKSSITLEAGGWSFTYELGSETPSVKPMEGTP